MSSRYTKSIPEFIYFGEEYNGWIAGPLIHPKKGAKNRKFKLVEVKIKESKVVNK